MTGNVIGANIFELSGVLGPPGLMRRGPTPDAAVTRDVPVPLLLSVTLLTMAYVGKSRPGRISRLEGAVPAALLARYQTSCFRMRDPQGGLRVESLPLAST